MDLSRADDLARGIVSAVLTDQVRDRGIVMQRGFGVVAVLGGLGWLLVDGWARWLIVPIIVVGLLGVVVLFVGRRVVLGAIARIAPPGDLEAVSSAVREALDEADLPDGPLGIARMVWRLRRGVGPEIQRLRSVVDRLVDAL